MSPSCTKLSEALERSHLPNRAAVGVSARDGDRFVAAGLGPKVQDATHFDVVRFPPPDWAQRHLAEAASDGRNAYTPYRGAPDVLQALALSLSPRFGIDLDPERHLLITPGTQAALFSLQAAVISPGDRVVIVDPDYLYSERAVRFLGGDAHHVPLVPTPDGLQPDLQVLADELRAGASLVLFSHPNNPTGAVYSDQTITSIAQLISRSQAFVIVDELYARLVYDQRTLPRLIAKPDMKDRCATVTGPSKTESLSGYRLGVAIGPPDVISAAEDLLAVMALRAPAYSQHLLKGWLHLDEEFVQHRICDLRSLRDRTIELLAESTALCIEPPPATAYLFIDAHLPQINDHVLGRRLVDDAQVHVSPGYQFGPSGHGSFRICYAREEHTWYAAVRRIADVLNNLGRC
jgi:aspartate/methionine/tyrosine aminotransferase